jgi:uncharacterized protein involved in exopolysaccharide biosynthesis
MPKIDINGIIREMTAEEVAEMEALNANIPVIPSREQELEDRIANLEAALAALLNRNGE